jgi:hypothetical protein
MPSVRVALALLVGVNAALALLAYWYYRSLLDYCEAENRALGRSGLDCLEPPHWFAINGMLLGALILELALLVVVGAAIVHRRRPEANKPT